MKKHHDGKEIGEVCLICDRRFSHHWSLDVHLETEHKNEPDRAPCDQCCETFPSIHRLRIHVKTSHKAVRKFDCDDCGKIFSSPQAAKTHKRTIHDKVKDFVCGYSAFKNDNSILKISIFFK